MLTLLFDGVAYGMLMFILAVGLATPGDNFINLRTARSRPRLHPVAMNRAGVPFLVCLPLAFLGTALPVRCSTNPLPAMSAAPTGAVLDRHCGFMAVTGRLCRRLDAAEHPPAGERSPRRIGTGSSSSSPAVLTIALQCCRTRFGNRLRAAVDPRVATASARSAAFLARRRRRWPASARAKSS
jgi:branched-chain amino acid transport system permease protein